MVIFHGYVSHNQMVKTGAISEVSPAFHTKMVSLALEEGEPRATLVPPTRKAVDEKKALDAQRVNVIHVLLIAIL
jgi:hypothetical protein